MSMRTALRTRTDMPDETLTEQPSMQISDLFRDIEIDADEAAGLAAEWRLTEEVKQKFRNDLQSIINTTTELQKLLR